MDLSWFWSYWMCDGVLLQLTEEWGEELFSALSRAGGKAFSNMAVGYNNVDVNAANKYGVAVGNTPVSHLFPLFHILYIYILNACHFSFYKVGIYAWRKAFSLIEYDRIRVLLCDAEVGLVMSTMLYEKK